VLTICLDIPPIMVGTRAALCSAPLSPPYGAASRAKDSVGWAKAAVAAGEGGRAHHLFGHPAIMVGTRAALCSARLAHPAL
jgi:hypothetical protein